MMTNKPVLLFDWGDTLMRDFPEYTTPMADWPRVEIMPGVMETLALLQPAWRLCMASNAAVSDEPDIRRALLRVDIDRWFEKVYCYRQVGFKKPDPQFFAYIFNDMDVQASEVVMVGDNLAADVLGANASGIQAVWFNWKTGQESSSPLHCTIHQFDHLPAALDLLRKG
jgi:HAD superfamily hydrolase (TIGR01509 family)